ATENDAKFERGAIDQARWRSRRSWTATEQALLTAAGMALHRGMFVYQVAKLADHTDALIARECDAGGDLHALIATTYERMPQPDAHSLAITHVAAGCGAL